MKNIIITSGGTSEYIDTVRRITNSGRGTLPRLVAEKLLKNNDNHVIYIHTKGALKPTNHDNLTLIEVTDTESVKNTVEEMLSKNKIDWFVHSMAISDYTVDYVSSAEKLYDYLQKEGLNIDNIKNNENIYNTNEKISSNEEDIIIKLKKTPKIINLIKQISPSTKLIGFKLLTDVTEDELIKVGYELLIKNKAEYVIANDLKHIKEGNHKAFLINKQKNPIKLEGKEEISDMINKIINSESI